MVFCTNCGQQNDDAAQVCRNCGATLPNRSSASSPYASRGTADAGAQQQQQGSPWAAATPYDTPGYGIQPSARGGGLLAVGEKREPVLAAVLPFVTCGIYGFYWWYVAITDIKNALGREDINPTTEILLGIVTCGIYFVYLAYKYPQLMLEMQDRVGLPRNDISTLSLILSVVGLYPIASLMIQTELNKIWDAAARRR